MIPAFIPEVKTYFSENSSWGWDVTNIILMYSFHTYQTSRENNIINLLMDISCTQEEFVVNSKKPQRVNEICHEILSEKGSYDRGEFATLRKKSIQEIHSWN